MSLMPYLWITFTDNDWSSINIITAYPTALEIFNGSHNIDTQGTQDLEGHRLFVFQEIDKQVVWDVFVADPLYE